jgi:hypothetical protein
MNAPPISLIAFPFSGNLSSGDHLSDRIPNSVTTSSTTVPALRTRVTARYRVGDSGDHRAGFETAIPWLASISLPAVVTGDCALPTVLPARYVSVVCTVNPVSVAHSFAARLRTETLAARLEASGVDEHAPVSHMHGICHHHSHMPIDPRPAVPAAVRLRGVVHAHRRTLGPTESRLAPTKVRSTAHSLPARVGPTASARASLWLRCRCVACPIEAIMRKRDDSGTVDIPLFGSALPVHSRRVRLPAPSVEYGLLIEPCPIIRCSYCLCE